ncbi:MAG: hypothetical protein KDA44_12525 [Planctomycetales bacterium]|nr:hypothetical protein [Planctomycetales bacterium]
MVFRPPTTQAWLNFGPSSPDSSVVRPWSAAYLPDAGKPLVAHVAPLDHGRAVIRRHRRQVLRLRELAAVVAAGDQIARAVGRKKLRNVPPRREAIARRPGLDRHAGLGKQLRQVVLVRSEPIVHAAAVGVEQLATPRVQVGGGSLGGAAKTKGAHLAIMIDRRVVASEHLHVAHDFGQPTLNDSQRIGHLKRPVCRRGVAEAVERARVGVGNDVGNAPWVAQDLHLLGDAARRTQQNDCEDRSHDLAGRHGRTPAVRRNCDPTAHCL